LAELERFVSPAEKCVYLPHREATFEYSLAPFSAKKYEDLMNQGCRKFGKILFRPVCQGCNACRPIRVPVAEFKPDRSQRRAWKVNENLELHVAEPKADPARIDLFNRYHSAQTERKEWPNHKTSAADYCTSFVENATPCIELTLWEGPELRAVILADATPNVYSAVYHFYDPRFPQRALGTASILHVIELARQHEKRWVYLGYHVAGCKSMAYKARFKPCEIMDEHGNWIRSPEVPFVNRPI